MHAGGLLAHKTYPASPYTRTARQQLSRLCHTAQSMQGRHL